MFTMRSLSLSSLSVFFFFLVFCFFFFFVVVVGAKGNRMATLPPSLPPPSLSLSTYDFSVLTSVQKGQQHARTHTRKDSGHCRSTAPRCASTTLLVVPLVLHIIIIIITSLFVSVLGWLSLLSDIPFRRLYKVLSITRRKCHHSVVSENSLCFFFFLFVCLFVCSLLLLLLLGLLIKRDNQALRRDTSTRSGKKKRGQGWKLP